MLFDPTKEPTFTDVKQGGAGTCYIMATMSALAEFPQMVKDLFVVPITNKVGIYAVKFYIRGKPWVVEVDDEFLFRRSSGFESKLVFA
jgi:hypothetical protein